jgi:hypothetical protein
MKVSQVIASKPINALFSISRETTVFHALEVMAEKKYWRRACPRRQPAGRHFF